MWFVIRLAAWALMSGSGQRPFFVDLTILLMRVAKLMLLKNGFEAGFECFPGNAFWVTCVSILCLALPLRFPEGAIPTSFVRIWRMVRAKANH